MGSRAAARAAGYAPKKSPTAAVMPRPSSIYHSSNVAGCGVAAASALLQNHGLSSDLPEAVSRFRLRSMPRA